MLQKFSLITDPSVNSEVLWITPVIFTMMHSIEVTKYQWIFRKCITIHFSIRFHCMWWYESRWNTMYYSTIISQDRLELVIINEITWSNLKLYYITGITASFTQNEQTLAPKSIQTLCMHQKLRLFVASFDFTSEL